MATAASLAAVLGGAMWIPVRLAIGASWNTTVAGLSYVEWNRLEVIPLTLLLVATPLLVGVARSRAARAGAAVAAGGLAGMLIGVVVEFWIFGGLAGDPAGATVGWMIYLLPGLLVHAVGLLIFGSMSRGRSGALASGIGVLHFLWLPAGLIGPVAVILDQALIGVGWIGIGLLGWRAAERDRRAVR